MPRTSREVAMNVRCNVLGYIVQRVKGKPHGARVSYREMERALGYSPSRVRRACRVLEQEGCVQRIPCFDEDGGQRANVYMVTRKGTKLIREGERASVQTAGAV